MEREGDEVLVVDGQLDRLSRGEIRARVTAFRPDVTVVTTAPSYLFWRCPPPELRVPQETVRDLREVGGLLVAVGPHGSTTPTATLRKLGVDAVILGECEEVLPQLARGGQDAWKEGSSIGYLDGDEAHIRGLPHISNLATLPPLRWPQASIQGHSHHHHRFELPPVGPGAEIEATRGCPYRCTFCAREGFRNAFRRRPLPVILEELDGLIAQGVTYVYFIDEIFMPHRALLEALTVRPVKFGVQLRIDLWSPEMLDLLGQAGCVSLEAGVESISEEGRSKLGKHCQLSTEELTARLIHAKRSIPFVQANLLDSSADDPAAIEGWRQQLMQQGVWANQPVPLFPYPGSPEYRRRWGPPDGEAWERAHEHYLTAHCKFSDIQEDQPLPLAQLEQASAIP